MQGEGEDQAADCPACEGRGTWRVAGKPADAPRAECVLCAGTGMVDTATADEWDEERRMDEADARRKDD